MYWVFSLRSTALSRASCIILRHKNLSEISSRAAFDFIMLAWFWEWNMKFDLYFFCYTFCLQQIQKFAPMISHRATFLCIQNTRNYSTFSLVIILSSPVFRPTLYLSGATLSIVGPISGRLADTFVLLLYKYIINSSASGIVGIKNIGSTFLWCSSWFQFLGSALSLS